MLTNVIIIKYNIDMEKQTKKTLKMLTFELCLIIVIILLYMLIKFGYIQKNIPSCYILKTTGMMCPSCGGTRCVTNFITGNFKEAFLAHPVFFIIIIYGIILDIIYIINTFTKKKIAKFIYPKVYYVIIVCVILIIYTIIRNVLRL